MRQAVSETGSVSVSFSRPSFSRWKTNSNVISLLIEAGGMGVKASFAHSTCPVAASIRTACSALVAICARAGSTAARRMARMAKIRERGMRKLLRRLLVDDDLGVIGALPAHAG